MLSNRPIVIPQSMRPPRAPEGLPRAEQAKARAAAMREQLAGGRDWFSRELAAKQHREDVQASDAAWDRTLREGLSLGRLTGIVAPRDPLTAEAQTWLHMFGRLDCRLDVSPHSRSLAYHIPQAAQDSGEAWPLIRWLDAAEPRIPGITARVIELAFNYDALEQVLVGARQKAADAQRAKADARANSRLAKQEA